ncbi:hypothetical protein [Pseudoduganella chitinolytica]|uniref:Uncharacterized protein n=1 Tax=Pseudoduganella chitinolytica TaxID=34070 RepID=A0ABY8BKA7_9BURK|nr:hypothetical protein [Pseudoduganella chitinolytica]WEF35768.1 hypothetical protein PX653_13790 [Pseudoduganella chitinolytica]
MTKIGTRGATVSVYAFKLYDIASDEFVLSKRYARMQTIERIGAVVVGPAIEVPADKVDLEGLTLPGYSPA